MPNVEAEKDLKLYGLSTLCIAVLVWVAFFGAYSGNPSQFERQTLSVNANQQVTEEVKSNGNAKDQGQRPGGSRPLAKVAGAGDSGDEKDDAPSKGEYWPGSIFGFHLKVTDSLLAFFTLLLVGVGVLQYLSLSRTDRATKEAVDVAKKSADAALKSADVATQTLVTSQRAWVRVEVEPSGPITLAGEKTSACVSVKVTNVGNLPALHVAPYVWLTAFIKDDNDFNMLKVQQVQCQKKRTERFPSYGITLFQNEHFPRSSPPGYFGNVPAIVLINWALAGSKNLNSIDLYIVGCVDYTFTTDQTKHHQTGFIYKIGRKSNAPIRLQDKTVYDWTLDEHWIEPNSQFSAGRYGD